MLIALGEAYLSLNQVEDAIIVVEDCLRDFSKDPAAYRARLLASAVYVEKGELARAKELLRKNLHHESLAPRSSAWRDSLFALGMILHDEGRRLNLEHQLKSPAAAAGSRNWGELERGHQLSLDAIRQLTEAVARYPQAEQVLRAQYAIAESHRHAARLPLAKLENESIESRRATLNRQVEQNLTKALEEHDRLIALMKEQGLPASRLSDTQRKILRNAYFARGTVLYDMGRYEDAINAYSTATSRYQHDPAALEAYVQIAACYRRMNRRLDARGTLEQAKLVMESIPAEADFNSTTRFGRDEWGELLNWLSTL